MKTLRSQLTLFGDALDRPPFFQRRGDRFESRPVNIGRWRYYVVAQVGGFGTWGKFPGHWWAVTLWKAEIDDDKVPRIRTRMWKHEPKRRRLPPGSCWR